MAVRYITKGKGRNRKSFPIRPKKKGVSVRSVSLQPSAVLKVNKQQIKLLNKGEPATFSKALNQVIIRAKRDGIPIYDTHVNSNDRRKPYMMWIVKHPEKGDKVKGSETIVMAEHYGQAIDDFITIWNKDKRMKKTIGYPQVQGTAEKSFRYARDPHEGGQAVLDTLFSNVSDVNRTPFFKKTGIKDFTLFGEDTVTFSKIPPNPNNVERITVSIDRSKDLFRATFFVKDQPMPALVEEDVDVIGLSPVLINGLGII